MANRFALLLMTGEEVRCFWGRKLTGAAILFWLNKYTTALYLGWDLATGLNISDKVRIPPLLGCNGSSSALSAMAFTALRVYALGRSLTLCAITAVLSLVPVGVNFVRLVHRMFVTILRKLIHTRVSQQANFGFGLTGENLVPFGCVAADNESIGLSQKWFCLRASIETIR
ncbi:hypothetical protein BD309DRAFT_878121 [Dichomitus squalens]|nr:hypothetical protein BD309DRAFT_878121 [Dichomitus squalens]